MPTPPPTPVVAPAQMDAALREVLHELLAPAAHLEILRRKELLTSEEVERLYGLNSGTLRNWRNAGEGPQFIRTGKLVHYRHEALQEFIADRRVRTYAHQA